ncbi:MAG: spore photoproduct lyase [Bacillota bacterium]
MRLTVFKPARVFIEEGALEHPLGKELWDRFSVRGPAPTLIGSHNRVGMPAMKGFKAYAEAKRTLVIGVRKTLSFQSCKPSAHYQLPLVTSCPGMCEYCYLMTTLGPRPYVRVYVNLDEILGQALEYVEKRAPQVTIFEGAATSDPLPLETLTGALAKAITVFGRTALARFRFATKDDSVAPLLDLDHGGHTEVRFSLNTRTVIRRHEHRVPDLERRVAAAARTAAAGYPVGFLIAPIFLDGDWRADYGDLLEELAAALRQAGLPGGAPPTTFELITHRFTPKAKQTILSIFPGTTLPLDESRRRWKMGQFGYGKYLYRAEEMGEVRSFFEDRIAALFPGAKILYLV